MLKKYLTVFFVSMVPLIELRGAIPYGVIFGLPLWSTYIIAIIGNMIPVPFIFLFARKILEWGADKPVIGKFFTFCLEKGHKGGQKLKATAGRGLFIALLLFVGIPLPGTGAWTGTLAAAQVRRGKNVYKFLGAAAAASGRPDKVRPHGGRISGAARCGGTVSVHIVAGQRVSGGRGHGVPVLPGAGL